VLRANDRFGSVRGGLIVDRDAAVVEAEGARAGRALAHRRLSFGKPGAATSQALILRSEAIARRETGVLPNALWLRVSKDVPVTAAGRAL